MKGFIPNRSIGAMECWSIAYTGPSRFTFHVSRTLSHYSIIPPIQHSILHAQRL
jgi:hypothetical protein